MSKRGDNIHKRKDGRWEGRYEKGRKPNGAIQYGSIYGKTYREVKEKLLMRKQNPIQEKAPLQKEKTFGEVTELWMENNRIRLKGGTIHKYQRVIDAQIISELGGVKISQITATQINAFLLQKLQNGRLDGEGALSAAYVKTITLIISAVMKFAVQEQFCQPLKSSISKPVGQKKDLTILGIAEQKKLETFLLYNVSPTKVGILISLYTGMRIGEICALKWEDIDFAKKTIRVRHTIARVPDCNDVSAKRSCLILDAPKTKTSLREIPISDMLLHILLDLQKISVSAYVVSSKAGFVSPRTYEYRYHKILEESGVRSVNYHVLRHTFATRCIEAGVDVKSLSEILGHANVGITLNTYVHSSMELKRAQLEKMFLLSA